METDLRVRSLLGFKVGRGKAAASCGDLFRKEGLNFILEIGQSLSFYV